jgi:hypothetical protein
MFPSLLSIIHTLSILLSLHQAFAVNRLNVLDSSSVDVDRVGDKPSSTNSEILVPSIDFTHAKWFNADDALENLRLSQTRISALLRTSMEPSNTESGESQRVVDADNEKLRDDIRRVHQLAGEIASENKRIQALPILRSSSSVYDDLDGYSFLQVADNSTTIQDWSYCACGSGPNGTLVFPDRLWPDPQFLGTVPPSTVNLTTSSPTSMIQIRLNGRRLALKQLPECNCTNPWEAFDNTSNMCKFINSVTVCLIHVSPKPSSETSQEISAQAQTLLDAIDKAIAPPSFMEIWSPFRFQL